MKSGGEKIVEYTRKLCMLAWRSGPNTRTKLFRSSKVKGSKNDGKNYREASLLSLPGKM